MSHCLLRASLQPPFFRRRKQLAIGLLACALCCAAAAQDAWRLRLLTDLQRVDVQHEARIGVYVRDLDTGVSASYEGDKRWYIASMVKVPIAIAVLRGVEQGSFTLDTPLTLRASDYVDGAGPTNGRPVGSQLTVRYLLDQMIIYSDNTASDVLIDLVGISEVNAVLESLVPDGFSRITGLGDIRRRIYGHLVPNAEALSGRDLIALNQQRDDSERLKLLSQRVDVPVAKFKLPTLEAAYSAYYASGLNSGRLDAYADLLTLLVEGKALGPTYTHYLLKTMDRVVTGPHRIKAGLPHEVGFAHKTGTQRRRTCDAGIVSVPQAAAEPKRVVVVACTRGELSVEKSDLALRQVGEAICRSGLLTRGIPDAPSCPVVEGAARPSVVSALPSAVALR